MLPPAIVYNFLSLKLVYTIDLFGINSILSIGFSKITIFTLLDSTFSIIQFIFFVFFSKLQLDHFSTSLISILILREISISIG